MNNMKNKKIGNSKKKKQKKTVSHSLCLKKYKYYQNIVQDTILCIQKYKSLDILNTSELNICSQSLENLFKETKNISFILSNDKKHIDYTDVVNRLQKIHNELIDNVKLYGTKNIEILLELVYGNDYIKTVINDTTFITFLYLIHMAINNTSNNSNIRNNDL